MSAPPASAYFAHAMPFGAALLPEGGVVFRLWAPQAHAVALVLGGEPAPLAADPREPGWYECRVPAARAGSRYRWRIDDALDVPDPASRFNPDGVHAASEVIDPCAFAWDADWKGRPWSEAVLYEMHIGTFTAEGTFAAAEARLAELAETGITALELMPVAAFGGRFGWGYDGVLPFAPHAPYGTPAELKHFIQAAHRAGLMVLLDVVYNHFGPDGNYLHRYAEDFFSKTHRNPWGVSLNFDGPGSREVRDFFLHNALYWLEEYRFDGLRLDAVHAMVDDSEVSFLDELGHAVRERIGDRPVHLVLENERNGHWLLRPQGSYDAQWNDDFHHALHVVLTGEDSSWYRDYTREPVALLARALTGGFVWEGSERSQGARNILQAPPAQPLGAMINFLNNHDQSGNRAFGERMNDIAPQPALELATALMLLGPSTPMLFAGEEYGARSPFLYFADWEGELRMAVVEGRQRDFGHLGQRANGELAEPPGPCDRSTFEASRLDWQAASAPEGRHWRGFVRRALAARRQWFTPRQPQLLTGNHSAELLGERSFVVRWRYEGGEVIELLAHVAAEPAAAAPSPWRPLRDAQPIFAVGAAADAAGRLAPWSATWQFGHEA